MAIGILLVTHQGIGSALIAAAEGMLHKLPLKTGTFDVPFNADPDALLPGASAALRRVDEGEGVLILTDMHGSVSSQLAARLARLGTPARRVSAVSLPMLLRVMDYAEMPLEEMPAIAAAGARNGVIHDDG